MQSLTLHVNQDFQVYKPTGQIFVERTNKSSLTIVFNSLESNNVEYKLQLTSQITDIVQEFIMVNQDNYQFTITIDISKFDCARYECEINKKHICQITITPEFQNIQMCTIMSHLSKNIMPLIKEQKLPYNWLHLTPVHKAGKSGSAYSLISWDDKDIIFSDDEIKQLQKYNIMTDIVLNHISNESNLLVELDNTFNNINRPDLKSSMVLDFHLWLFEYSILKHNEKGLQLHGFDSMKKNSILQEYFMQKFQDRVIEIVNNLKAYEFDMLPEIDFYPEAEDYTHFVEETYQDLVTLTGKRNGAILNTDVIFKRFNYLDEKKIKSVTLAYNQFIRNRHEKEQHDIVNAIMGSAKYQLFSQDSCPHWFVQRYFSPVCNIASKVNQYFEIEAKYKKLIDEAHGYTNYVSKNGYTFPDLEEDKFVLAACNGWVMGPSKDFIAKNERIYQTRGLISWGDLVKLNFNPKLEKQAIQYVQKQAKMFNGLRIDNAHNTNQLVLQKILKEAKKVNKNLLVMLEIFSGDEGHDGYLTQIANGDITVKEMVHYDNCDKLAGLLLNSSFRTGMNLLNQYLEPINCNIHAPKFLFDITHDNIPFGNYHSQHGIGNFLTYAFLGAFAQGTSFSTTYGSDQAIIEHIEVVSDDQYSAYIDINMFKARKFVFDLRKELVLCEEIYADNHNDFIIIERSGYSKQDQYLLIAVPDYKSSQVEKQISITIPGKYKEVMFYAGKNKNSKKINDQNYSINDFVEMKKVDNIFIQQNKFDFDLKFQAVSGDVIVIQKQVNYLELTKQKINEHIQQFKKEFSELGVSQTKYFLALSELEEIELTGMKLFDFSGITPTQCGFDAIKDCIITQNVDSPVANCLRQGNWFYDYMLQRNIQHKFDLPSLDYLLTFIKDNISPNQKPKCTFELFTSLDLAINQQICEMLNIQYDKLAGQLYRAGLLLISFRPQWSNVDVNKWLTDDFKSTIAKEKSTNQTPVSQSETESVTTKKHRQSKLLWKHSKPANPLVNISLCAGFPHFFDGMFRSWGRDIALAVTGLIPDSVSRRVMLVSTASLLRHGLLPNLQDSGRIPRYNCRDAVWFWLCNVVEYMEEFGDEILNDSVKRIFLLDEEENYYFDELRLQYLYKQEVLAQVNKRSREMTIKEVIHEILSKHWNGIDFEEWKCHDDNMRPEGKFVNAYVDHKTGLVYGGNEYNCHTWMDKMGGSQLCGNRGIPSTTRCGAAIEINLCARKVLLVFKKHFKDDFISQWQVLINKNIHTYKDTKNGFKYLKDVISYTDAKNKEQDYLLRPNSLIGLSFQEPEFILQFKDEINTCYKYLQDRFSIGMKTLAPFETRYSSFYNNDDMSCFETGNGFSYHNGPEWVHCNGRGLICLKKIGEMELYNKVLVNIRRHMDLHCNVNMDYRSLPELTQGNAEICINSCQSQSWALGSVLQALLIK